MNIEIIHCLNDNYSYLIRDDQTNTVAIIDPSEFGPCDEKIDEKYKKLDFILVTHHHFDHVGGNTELKKKYNSKILGFEKDEKRIPGIDILLKDDQNFKIGNLEFKTLFVPGHTSGHIAFYFEKEKVVFTGDTLFSLGCGRVFEGTCQQMFESLNKIKNLPGDTKIYCGHEYTLSNARFIASVVNNDNIEEKIKILEELRNTNGRSIPTLLSDEMDLNLFLKADNNEVARALGMENANALDVFTRLRSLKDNF